MSALLAFASQGFADEKADAKARPICRCSTTQVSKTPKSAAPAGDWKPTDDKAWKVDEKDDEQFYSQFKASDYKPKYRSPFNYTLLKEHDVGDFVLEVRVQSTRAEYGHRDACFFFGWQDPDHFYYVHIATKADDNANQVFIVNGSLRERRFRRPAPREPNGAKGGTMSASFAASSQARSKCTSTTWKSRS